MSFSYKGKILISTPVISGDVFARSVVLMIEHSPSSGAFGLILNKKNQQMSDRLFKVFGYPVEVYEGGPVENDRIFFIVKGEPVVEEYTVINQEFYLTEQGEEVITALMDNRLQVDDFKVFSGYSGWSPLQLEAEIKEKMWTVVDVYHLDYTLPNDHTLWKNIMQNLGGEFLLWANTPDNVQLN